MSDFGKKLEIVFVVLAAEFIETSMVGAHGKVEFAGDGCCSLCHDLYRIVNHFQETRKSVKCRMEILLVAEVYRKL